MTPVDLQAFFSRPTHDVVADPSARDAHAALLDALEAGTIRSAERADDGSWHANTWVKQAILLGFRWGTTEAMPGPGFDYFDKSSYPARRFTLDDQVRLVPGGSSVRRGAHVAPGVVVMPPAYINVGAYVGPDTMVDSHALVGSCAQIGARVHLSAAAQIGGVLEPAGAVPVVVEDDVFIGGFAGLFEGIVVRERAVLASGVTITGATPIIDLVNDCEWHREVPAGAVVVPGSRPARGDVAVARGIQVAAPVIVKYRDAKTDASLTLEDALRTKGTH